MAANDIASRKRFNRKPYYLFVQLFLGHKSTGNSAAVCCPQFYQLPKLRSLRLHLRRPKPKPLQAATTQKTTKPKSVCKTEKTLFIRQALSKRLHKSRLRNLWTQNAYNKAIASVTNQKGSALLQIVALLPVFISLLIYQSTLNISLSKKSQALNECRIEVLKIQKHLSSQLKKLLKLNKQAKSLRNRKLRAKVRLAAAIASKNAPLVYAMRAEIKYLTQLQYALATKQKFILVTANTNYMSWKLKNHLSTKTEPSALSVKPKGHGIAPVYKTDLNFVSQQKIHLQKNVSYPKYLQLVHTRDFKVQCAASIEDQKIGGKQWEYTLVAAKSSLSY